MQTEGITAVNAHRFAPAAPGEEYIYGACTPGWHSAADHDTALGDWIEFMQAEGIERVCCLLPGRQLAESGANIDRYERAFGEENVLHAPVPDHHLIPEPLLREEILPFLVEGRNEEQHTVVHCLSGIGRTGQVLAAWLVYNRDYGPEKAIETVQSNCRDPTDAVHLGDATEDELYELLGAATVA
jgi:protein-tyrosine phosphatase